MSIQYHEVFCENSKATYGEFDICDFIMVGEGRDLIANSVRIEGDLRVTTDGATRTTNQNVMFDNMIGAHGLCEAVSVEFENMGIVQRLNEYPRLVNMRARAVKDENDVLNSVDIAELRTPNERYSQQYCYGVIDINDTNTTTRDLDFSFKPEICVNMMAGGNLSMDKTGYIKVSLTLARNVAFLYGRDVDVNYTYILRNLRLCYKSIPAQTNNPKVQMRSSVMIKNSINSTFSNTSAKVPAVSDGCSVSFLQQNKENTPLNNNYALENMPQVDELQFLFNDTSTFIRYVINDRGDMLKKFLESMGSSTHNQVNVNKWKSNQGYGLGVNFNQFVDLSGQKFNTQIKSADTNINNRPMLMYSYFHSLIQV